jgi:CRISPR-associated protein Csh2
MAFNKRREYLFAYTVKDANPNGDPLDANHPRYDEESGQIMVSDVRIKRTIRDQWKEEGYDVFVDGEPKTLKKRVEELKEKLGVDKGEKALAECIDTRLFGATFALGKESFAWTGPVQFKWGRSFHRAEEKMIQGTAAFATNDDSGQRSFRNEYIVPFAAIGVYGIANQHASDRTGAIEDDLDALESAIWKGTANLITRSKIGHTPKMLMAIKYNEDFNGSAGALDEHLCLRKRQGDLLTEDEQLALRSLNDVDIDITLIKEKLANLVSDIESVTFIYSKELNIRGLEELENMFGGKLLTEAR